MIDVNDNFESRQRPSIVMEAAPTGSALTGSAPTSAVCEHLVSCLHCKRQFRPRGINRHLVSCPLKPAFSIQPTVISTSISTTNPTDSTAHLTNDSSESANLPPYEHVPRVPTTTYNNTDGHTFVNSIEHIYSTIIQWRKNLFQTPSGSAGKIYIKLLTTWLKHFNDNSSFKGVAMKVYMILPCLMLQKPSRTSKSRDHTKALERRFHL